MLCRSEQPPCRQSPPQPNGISKSSPQRLLAVSLQKLFCLSCFDCHFLRHKIFSACACFCATAVAQPLTELCTQLASQSISASSPRSSPSQDDAYGPSTGLLPPACLGWRGRSWGFPAQTSEGVGGGGSLGPRRGSIGRPGSGFWSSWEPPYFREVPRWWWWKCLSWFYF